MPNEEQLLTNTEQKLVWDATCTRFGVRLTITDRTVSGLTFKLLKIGTPSGTLTFQIRKVSDDSIVVGKLWGNAVDLTTTATWYTVMFDSPTYVNEEVRICVTGSAAIGPDLTNCPLVCYQSTDVKASERAEYYDLAWIDYSPADGTYIYLYGEGGAPPPVISYAPTVVITYIDDVTRVAATAHCSILDIGSFSVTQYGICWSTSENPTTADSKTELGAGSVGGFTSQATGLTQGTTYYIRAYATNSVGTAYSAQAIITTLVAKPIVSTGDCTNVATTTATGNGTIISIGDAVVTQHGHCWNTTGTPTVADSKVENGAGAVGAFTSAITGLTAGLTYYVRAYATNSYGTSYGGVDTIYPSALNVAPTVTTQECTSVIKEGATGNGTVVSLGTPAQIQQHGHCWSTSPSPTTSDSKTELGPTTTLGTFTSSMRGMSANTLYYVRAYARNQAGIGYGANVVIVTNTGGESGGGSVISYPSLPITRVTNLIHRYDRYAGIYQLEMSLGDTTSIYRLPYELGAKRATGETQREQDTEPIVEAAVKEVEKRVPAVRYQPLLTSDKVTAMYQPPIRPISPRRAGLTDEEVKRLSQLPGIKELLKALGLGT